ncbi:alpha-amylase family glycosyl hydrolase [Nannocystis sp. ILAH1]|uniref:alpha-amylase family glycosyl hydrolase n=1 Tax=unclassified Nannocystis TaxID=2627009 RepID=UPI002270FC56|nr:MULTISPECIES: alpha-amylase family glycosyl hydrolase [unclassified Nannocystis]MCY0986655.1 alpha-amylase family glycosyl hydrolase [Nannocystis sp. ILAH1]MCY1071535.1 alpha-amylase family glycosyl hydrolase [Nannocystis sp. RBIL2]
MRHRYHALSSTPLLFAALVGCPAPEAGETGTETATQATTDETTGAASFPTTTTTEPPPTTSEGTTDGTATDTGEDTDTGEPSEDVDLDPWRDAIMYFVFVDRFANGDPGNDAPIGAPVDPEADYLGGDWKGITDKIEEGYFTALGVDVLWLSVPMDNPSKGHPDLEMVHYYSGYHSYWPEHLDQPEEHFGTMEEFKALVDAAHAKGLRVVLDYAMNHVYIDSPVYDDHPEWFWPLDQDYGGETKECLCGHACSWDEPTERKRCWFTPYLPDFDFTNPEARKFSIDNALWWITETGIDGYRLDALKHIEDEWILEFRDRVEQEIEPQTKAHFYTVGETFTGDKALLKYYVEPGRMLDGQFDFPMRMAIAATVLRRQRTEEGVVKPTSMQELDQFLTDNEGFYEPGLMSNFLGNHDIPRVIHQAEDTPRWDNEWSGSGTEQWDSPPPLPAGVSAFERLASAYTVMLTLNGIPLIYYGDEIGMAGAGDPDNRRMMDWDDAAYTEGQKLLLTHVKKMTAIRKQHPALSRGARTTLSVTDETFAYEKTDEDSGDRVLVVINRSDEPQTVEGVPAGSYTDLLSGDAVEGGAIEVSARTSLVLTQ